MVERVSDVLVAQIFLPHVGSPYKSTQLEGFWRAGSGREMKGSCVVMSTSFHFSSLLNNLNRASFAEPL